MSVLKPFVVVVAIAAAGSAASASAQAGNRGTAGGAEERSVYASVLNKEGAPVTTLDARDFVVREGRAEREVVDASPASEPMRIAVLVDTSQAMQRHVSDLRAALRGFFREMQGNHEIALFEFGDRPTRLVDYTRDPSRLEAGIGRVFGRSGSGSYVLDAIIDVSRDFRAREAARPVIIVITAEGPEFSQRSHQVVLDDLRAANATLHAFVLTRHRSSFFNDGLREREFALSKGAKLTGGRREDLFTSMALTDRLADLAGELKTQYRVVYVRPEMMVPPRTMDITVKQPRLTVRAPRVPFGAGTQP
jgi:VWFA-related protein